MNKYITYLDQRVVIDLVWSLRCPFNSFTKVWPLRQIGVMVATQKRLEMSQRVQKKKDPVSRFHSSIRQPCWCNNPTTFPSTLCRHRWLINIHCRGDLPPLPHMWIRTAFLLSYGKKSPCLSLYCHLINVVNVKILSLNFFWISPHRASFMLPTLILHPTVKS